MIAAALGASALTALAGNALPLPSQWLLAGESPRQYVAGVDMDTTASGKGAKFMRHAKGKWPALGENFWQVHRGYVVAVRRIAAAVRDDGGALWLKLREHPARLPVSQRYQHRFKGM